MVWKKGLGDVVAKKGLHRGSPSLLQRFPQAGEVMGGGSPRGGGGWIRGEGADMGSGFVVGFFEDLGEFVEEVDEFAGVGGKEEGGFGDGVGGEGLVDEGWDPNLLFTKV